MTGTQDLIQRFRLLQEQTPEPSAEELAKREVAAVLRRLVHAVGTSRASVDTLLRLAADLRTRGEAVVGAGLDRESDGEPVAGTTGMEDFRHRSPITGPANPMAPPATLAPDLEAGVVRGEVTFGSAFEGAPGCVHGGFVSALLDEALGMACIFSGAHGMTGELTTRYLRTTPVRTPLRVEARLVSTEGRKIRSEGELYHGDVAVAECTGLFIAVDTTVFEELAAAKAGRARGQGA